MKVNKKGQEMSVTTLVLIVIGVVLLVMLILGFSMGWQNLWGKINVLGGGSNVVTVIEACKIAATSDSTYSYCSEFKKVTIGSETRYFNCEAPEVLSGLDKKLTCGTGDKDPVKVYCATLVKDKTDAQKEDIKKIMVNTNKCGDFADLFTAPTAVKCTDPSVGGTLTPLTPGCVAPKVQLPGPFTDVTDPAKGPICCK